MRMSIEEKILKLTVERDKLKERFNLSYGTKNNQKKASELYETDNLIQMKIEDLNIEIWKIQTSNYISSSIENKNCHCCGTEIEGTHHMEGTKAECMKCYGNRLTNRE